MITNTPLVISDSFPNTLMGKVMGLVMNVDKMVGGQFAQGLANLKAVVEPH